MILCGKKTTADYGRKRGERQTDSPPPVLDGFSTYLDCRRLRFRHQVWPIVIYILGMWHKLLLILTRTEEITPDYKFLQSFSFLQKYLSNKLAFSDRKKKNQLSKAFLTNANLSVPVQVQSGPPLPVSGHWGGSPGRAAASSWGQTANPQRDSARRCITSPLHPHTVRRVPCSQLRCCLIPLGCPTGRSALRCGCEIKWAPAPLRPEGGSYLRLLTPPLPPVHSLAVILALLLLLGNHTAAAETLSAL